MLHHRSCSFSPRDLSMFYPSSLHHLHPPRATILASSSARCCWIAPIGSLNKWRYTVSSLWLRRRGNRRLLISSVQRYLFDNQAPDG